MPEIKVLAGLAFSEGYEETICSRSLFGLWMAVFPLCLHIVCIQISYFHKTISHIRLGSTLITRFQLNCFCKDTVSKYSNIPKSWGLRIQGLIWRDTVQPVTPGIFLPSFLPFFLSSFLSFYFLKNLGGTVHITRCTYSEIYSPLCQFARAAITKQ